MAYTTPATWSAGAVLTAAQLNQQLRDNLLAAFPLGPTVVPRGVLGYAQVTANQASIGTGGADLTGLTVTVTVAAGRRIRVTGHVRAWAQTVANARIAFRIQESTTVLNEMVVEGSPTAGNAGDGAHVLWVGTPSAAGHTYKLTAGVLDTGTTTMHAAATYPAFILVEDIGSA